jgi:hypothetical protein
LLRKYFVFASFFNTQYTLLKFGYHYTFPLGPILHSKANLYVDDFDFSEIFKFIVGSAVSLTPLSKKLLKLLQ